MSVIKRRLFMHPEIKFGHSEDMKRDKIYYLVCRLPLVRVVNKCGVTDLRRVVSKINQEKGLAHHV